MEKIIHGLFILLSMLNILKYYSKNSCFVISFCFIFSLGKWSFACFKICQVLLFSSSRRFSFCCVLYGALMFVCAVNQIILRNLIRFAVCECGRRGWRSSSLAAKRLSKWQIIAEKRLTMQTKPNYSKIDALNGYRYALDIGQLLFLVTSVAQPERRVGQ